MARDCLLFCTLRSQGSPILKAQDGGRKATTCSYHQAWTVLLKIVLQLWGKTWHFLDWHANGMNVCDKRGGVTHLLCIFSMSPAFTRPLPTFKRSCYEVVHTASKISKRHDRRKPLNPHLIALETERQQTDSQNPNWKENKNENGQNQLSFQTFFV